uniref:Kinetochore protein SPC25 n=2 Tax=Rhizophora mucronata TaxID=61149 RepID=A0A2P2J9A6_RHIMU
MHTEMQSRGAESVRERMERLRGICDREVPIEIHRMDSIAASYCKSLDSIKARAQETVQNRIMLGKMKGRLREADDEFVKVLAVKTRNEAKQMAARDSISAARARIEEVKRTLQLERARRDEYAATLSQQALVLAAFEGKGKQENELRQEVQEAILWYNKVLGFQIEGGHGVKFTFNNINVKNPHEEYSFTIRHENDTYTLLACDPTLSDTKDLVIELNRTNGLFKFVRTMREKFKEAASLGDLSQLTSFHQESSISLSAPVLSVSTDRSESPETIYEHPKGEVKVYSTKINHGRGESSMSLSPSVLSGSTDTSESPVIIDENPERKVKLHPKKVNHGRGIKQGILSPPRRSPRFFKARQ